MHIMPVLCIAWIVVTAFLVMLLAYRATLTRNEDDQLCLAEASHVRQVEQQTILSRLNRVQPFLRAATALTCLLTTAIVGTFVWQAFHQVAM